MTATLTRTCPDGLAWCVNHEVSEFGYVNHSCADMHSPVDDVDQPSPNGVIVAAYRTDEPIHLEPDPARPYVYICASNDESGRSEWGEALSPESARALARNLLKAADMVAPQVAGRRGGGGHGRP